MAYVDRLDVASSTVADLMIADSAVRTDADARVVALGDLGVAQSCIVSGGTLQALAATHNGLIDGAKIYDGQLIVRSAGNSGKNWDVYGGAAYVQQGAAVTNVNVYDGGTLYQSRGTIENATIYAGGKSLKNGDGQIVWKNLDVKAGGSVVFLHTCVIAGNINIEEGSYIYQGTTDSRDADVYAVNGTIYNLNQASGIYYSSGITLSNCTVNYGATAVFYSSAAVSDTIDSGTIYISSGAVGRGVRMEGPAAVRYNVYKGGVAYDTVISGGTMHLIDAAGGGYASGVTVSGGALIVRSAGNVAENVKVYDNICYIQSGASGSNVTVYGGSLACQSGTLNGGTILGGKVTFNNGFTVSGVTMTGGEASANATLTLNQTQLLNLNVQGGTVAVNAGSVLTDANITAGTVTVVGTISGCDISGTGKLTLNGGFKLAGDIDFAAGQLTNDDDAYAENGTIYNLNNAILGNFGHGITLRNYTQTTNTGNLREDAVADGGTVTGGTFQALNNNGADGAVIRNFVYDGGQMIVRGETNRIESTTFKAGNFHIQSGASGADLTLEGGTLNVHGLDAYRAYVSGATVTGGTANIGANTDAYAIAVAGGTVNLNGKNDTNQTHIYNATVTGGAFNVGSNAYVHDVSVSGDGTMTLAGGFGLFGDVNFAAGRLTNDADAYAVNGTIYNFDAGTYGFVGHGITLSNFAKATAGNLNLVDDAVADGGTVTAGTLQALNNNGADGAEIKNATIDGGTIIIRGETNSGGNITIEAGTLYVQSGASAANVTLNGGTLAVESAGSIVDGVQYNGGSFIVYSGTTIKNLHKAVGGETNIRGNGVVDGGAVSAGYLQALANAGVPADGAVIKNYAISSGAAIIVRGETNRAENITVSSGGVLHVQTNATADGVEVLSGGKAQNDNGTFAGAVVSNLTLRAGATGYFTNATSGARIVGLTMEDGASLRINSGWVSGGTVAGGTLDFSTVTISGLAMTGGSLETNGTINVSAATIANLTQTTGNVRLSAGAVLNGGHVSGYLHVSEGGVANDVTLDDYRFYVSAGGRAYRSIVRGGEFYVYGATGDSYAEDLTVSGGQAIIRSAGNSAQNVAVSDGGKFHVQQGASGSIIDVQGGLLAVSGNADHISEVDQVVVSGGSVTVNYNAVLKDVNMTGGTVSAINGGVVSAVVGNTLYNAYTSNAAKICFVKDGSQATLAGDKTAIAEGTLWYEDRTSGASVQLTGHGTNGVIEGLGAGDAAYKLSIGSGIVLSNATGNNFETRISAFSGAKLDGVLFGAGAIIGVNGASVEFDNVTLSGGHGSTCNLNLSAGGQTATDTVIGGSGAKLQIFGADAKIENTTILAGGSLNLAVAGVDTGKLVTLDFSGTTGNQFVDITNLSRLAADTTLAVRGFESGATYTFTKGSSATDKTLDLGKYRVFDMAVAAGKKYANGFLGLSFDFTTGKALTTTSFTVGTQTAAAELDNTNATVLADGGLAAKWDSTTDVTTVPAAVAGANTTGDAWLTVNEADLATALYGAEGNFGHDVNLWLHKGTVRNLAAGATAGGSVENVSVLVGDTDVTDADITFSGTAYAGGFGNVTGKTESLIYKGTFEKDFYAGALANKLTTTTSVGDVSMTIDGGTFSGNIFGASAVKTDTTKGNGTRHTAGDVTLTVTGGSTTKGTQACIFAGGYATGDATGTVYTVDSVTATISGGSWGEAAGGRGIFGGIMASGVTAQAGNVNLTVSGGSMGNVYGGGWAQKTNGKSIVGDVNISISGGTVANVFGGGSHSTSGGSTETGDITITVSGGNITGDIYARGQLDGDTTGAAGVIFTGAANFNCGVFGYSYVGGAGEGAALSFTGYTGTLSGNIGGFDGITLDGSTVMTLSTESGNVSNGSWEFDFTDRADTLAGTSFLTWDNADFAGDTVKVNFTDATQAASEWSIADAAFDATTTFELYIGGTEITSVAYDTAIADGDWAGWKFTDENGTLKFKQLA